MPQEVSSRSLSPAVSTQVFDTYWRFAVERQAIFFRRYNGAPPPWTTDPILSEFKFTNAYRASDRVSQYLIRNIIYKGDTDPAELFFRIILFKIFNRIETWQLLLGEMEEVSFRSYNYRLYDSILSKSIESGKRIYSAAYIMPSFGAGFSLPRKHRMHLQLLECMMSDKLPDQLLRCKSMGQAFELLRGYPTIGDFLAYQYVTDLNYSPLTNFTEMEFVMPGPGAIRGIHKCFSSLGGLNEAELIKWVTERQKIEFEARGLVFKDLWGRPLQLIDCQNLFCEVDKYSRVAHPEIGTELKGKRIKQKFAPKGDPIDYWYPPKWGINEIIRKEHPSDSAFLGQDRG